MLYYKIIEDNPAFRSGRCLLFQSDQFLPCPLVLLRLRGSWISDLPHPCSAHTMVGVALNAKLQCALPLAAALLIYILHQINPWRG